jgi:alkaline phosphatase D
MDCRTHRDASMAPDDGTKTMLGAVQKAWLLDAVATSAATFKLIFSSVPLDFGNGVDHWSGYVRERDEILDALADAAVPGVLFLSADQHWFGAHVHRHGAREFQVGPLARAPLLMPPLRPGVLARADEYNTGVLDIDENGVRVRVLGAAGGVLWDETLTAEMLTLRRT